MALTLNDPEFEINRPRDAGRLYKFFIDFKFREAVSSFGYSIKGRSVLDLCCGSGMATEYYAHGGAKVNGIDLSGEAIRRAAERKRIYRFSGEFLVAGVERLPFKDSSFDIVSVHDGLHHLKQPKNAIKEMCRVSRGAIVIMEPAKAFLTRIAVFFRISARHEGDDFVYRFDPEELRLCLQENGFKKIATKRYLMYYPHKPGQLFCLFNNGLLFNLSKALFHLVNKLFGRFGNKLQIVAFRE